MLLLLADSKQSWGKNGLLPLSACDSKSVPRTGGHLYSTNELIDALVVDADKYEYNVKGQCHYKYFIRCYGLKQMFAKVNTGRYLLVGS